MERIVGKLEFEVLDAPDFKLFELYHECTAYKLSDDSLMSRLQSLTRLDAERIEEDYHVKR